MPHVPIVVLIALEQQRKKLRDQRPALQLPLHFLMEEIPREEEEEEEKNPRGILIIPMW